MLEALLARHAAPVLAGMKTANLFSVQGLWLHDLQREIFALTKQLAKKGLRLMLLCPGRGRALVYVYRPALLARDLERPEARALLSYLGYPQDLAGCLLALKRRMAHNAQFPHEIGLFLGYPLCDVLGFLRHAGRHSKCAGLWQVYDNVDAALALFAKYKKCADVYAQCYQNGTSIWQLTVAA